MMDYLPPSRSRGKSQVIRRQIDSTLHLNRISAVAADVSQPSLGGTDRGDDPDCLCSPPPSPMFSTNGQRSRHAAQTLGSKTGGATRKYQDSSLDADDTESELVAIPESDLSDSTNNRSSAPDSFDESCNYDDTVAPLPSEAVAHKTFAPSSTLNLAQLAMSTLGVSESVDEVSIINFIINLHLLLYIILNVSFPFTHPLFLAAAFRQSRHWLQVRIPQTPVVQRRCGGV